MFYINHKTIYRFTLVCILTIFQITHAAIWQPTPGASWQWQLTGSIDTSYDVDMYDIDLFDTPATTISALHNAGKKVICYFSAGSYEEWRADANQFPSSLLGNPLDDWEGETWLDIRSLALRPIMEARLDLAVAKNCDGVEPDNIDGYQNDPGFDLDGEDQLTYNRWLAQQAHQRGLSIGLKNDLDQVNELVNDFDWAINEQCFKYNECDRLEPFINAGKAVFGVEYVEDEGNPDDFCPDANARQFSWLQKKLELDAEVIKDCRDYKDTSAPAPTTLQSPKGTVTNDDPTYKWNAVSNSSWYYLWVNDSTGNVIKKWYAAAQAGCASGTGTCSVNHTTSLAEGNGEWWVQTWNSFGYGSWSNVKTFFISTSTLTRPQATSLISPNGNISDTTPTYRWNAVSGSSWYYLWVNDSSGNVIKKWYTAAQAGCASGTGTCSVNHITSLGEGSGEWWVQTWNSFGYGPWSTSKQFVLGGPEVTSPTLISPSGILRTPLSHDFKWNSVTGADEYHLWVNDSSGNVIKQWVGANEASCDSGDKTCHFPAIALASGQGRWWVQARTPNGTSPWSPTKNFTINNSISVPYDENRFRTVLNDSKLQGTRSNKVVERSEFADYSSENFYLSSGQDLVFQMRGEGTRSELRQLDEWYTSDSTANKMIAEEVKLIYPTTNTLDQYTWMQAHDSGSFNKPLIRLVWHRSREGLNDYLWAVVRHSSTIEECTSSICTWEPLVKRPDGFFKAELRVENNTMKVKIDNNIVLEENVVAWEDLPIYFKAGVYLNGGEGEAEVHFRRLKYYD